MKKLLTHQLSLLGLGGVLTLAVACSGGGSSKKSTGDGFELKSLSTPYDPAACAGGDHSNTTLQSKSWYPVDPTNGEVVTSLRMQFKDDDMFVHTDCGDGLNVSVSVKYSVSGNTLNVLEDMSGTSEAPDGSECYGEIHKGAPQFSINGDDLTLCDPAQGNATLTSN